MSYLVAFATAADYSISGASALSGSLTTATTSLTLYGLVVNTSFVIAVSATNTDTGSGYGPRAITRAATAARGSVPSSPTNIDASASSTGDVTVSWAAPLDIGGTAVTSYRVYANSVLIQSTDASAFGVIDTPTAASVTYYVVRGVSSRILCLARACVRACVRAPNPLRA